MNINTFVINKPLSGSMLKSDGDIIFRIMDFKDPKLTVSTETEDAVDALGTPIMQFDRSKKVDFSATKANLDLSLVAARGGNAKRSGTVGAPVYVPKWETFENVASNTTTITLAETPYAAAGVDPVPYIWETTDANPVGTRYALSDTAASATEFTISAKTITLPTGRSATSNFLVYYEYAGTGATGLSAVEVDYAVDRYPTAGKFVLEVLGHDICDPLTEYVAWIVMPYAKLNCDIDLTLNATTTDDFKLTAMPPYCGSSRTGFKIVIAE